MLTDAPKRFWRARSANCSMPNCSERPRVLPLAREPKNSSKASAPLLRNVRPILLERGSRDQASPTALESAAGAREHRRFIGMLLLSLRLLLVGIPLSISMGWFLLFLFLHTSAATIFRHPGKPAIWRARDPAISQFSGSASPVASAYATTAAATIAVKGGRWPAGI